MSALGQKQTSGTHAHNVRFTPESRHRAHTDPASQRLLKRATQELKGPALRWPLYVMVHTSMG